MVALCCDCACEHVFPTFGREQDRYGTHNGWTFFLARYERKTNTQRKCEQCLLPFCPRLKPFDASNRFYSIQHTILNLPVGGPTMATRNNNTNTPHQTAARFFTWMEGYGQQLRQAREWFPGWTSMRAVRQLRHKCVACLCFPFALFWDALQNLVAALVLLFGFLVIIAAHVLGMLFGLWLLVVVPFIAPFLFWEGLYWSGWKQRHLSAFATDDCVDAMAVLRFAERLPDEGSWCWQPQQPHYFLYRRVALPPLNNNAAQRQSEPERELPPRWFQFAHTASTETPSLDVRISFHAPDKALVMYRPDSWSFMGIPPLYHWATVGVAAAAIWNSDPAYDYAGRLYALVTQTAFESTTATWLTTVGINQVVAIVVLRYVARSWYAQYFLPLTPWEPVVEDNGNDNNNDEDAVNDDDDDGRENGENNGGSNNDAALVNDEEQQVVTTDDVDNTDRMLL